MNESAVFHISDGSYCFAIDEKTLTIRLRTARNDIESAKIIYANKYDWTKSQYHAKLDKSYSDKLFDFFEITLSLSDTRFAYIFLLTDNFGKKHFYSENGVTDDYDFKLGHYNFFQVPYINDADIFRPVSWIDDAVFYQIFVERFHRGNCEKNSTYIDTAWGEKPLPKSFFGGDLDGITQKLDYIASLKANVIYLTPIFESSSNHKYDIIDYYNVDEMFGGEKALLDFIKACKQRGIRVILDAVFNHCSEQNLLFQDVIAKGKASKYFDWFLINGKNVDTDFVNYETFASCKYMPRFNTSNAKLRKYLINIGKYYIEKFDIDGWRLDVSDEVSHVFWREFRQEIKGYKDKIIIGENWHNAGAWLRGDEFDGIMNYGFTKACLDYFAFGAFDAEGYKNRLSELLMRYSDTINKSMLNLLECHDTERFLTMVGSKKRLLAGYSVMFCYEGMPCLYYGSEIGLSGGYDPDCRRCFDWNEDNWDSEILSVIKKLIELRRDKRIGEGKMSLIAKNDVFILRRRDKERTVTLYVNMSGETKKINACGENLMTASHIDNYELASDDFLIVESY